MGRNLEKDAVEMAAKNQRILEKGLAIFSRKGIDNVTMTDVAKAAGIGIASLYRYYSTKPELVLAIGAWGWKEYLAEQAVLKNDAEQNARSGVERMNDFLDGFLDLYLNHKDLLRFNQFFNLYLLNERIPQEKVLPYNSVIRSLEDQFTRIYQKGQEDGTIRSDLSEEEIFSTMTHLMLAAVSRYATGLVYVNRETDAVKELKIQKDMLMCRFCTEAGKRMAEEKE